MGFLLVQVAANERVIAETNVAPVSAELIPNIGELAMEAASGVLLHRSQVASFAGLARRPRAGGRASRGSTHNEAALYIPIPSNCVGVQCNTAILPAYSFSSSRPDIGNFVKPNLAVEPKAVLLEHEEPVADPESGLFCAYNAGKTVVTIDAGGLSSSLTVTVQAGSVRRPCGTQPLKEVPVQEANVPAPVPTPAPTPAPAGQPPASSPPPVVPVPPAPHRRRRWRRRWPTRTRPRGCPRRSSSPLWQRRPYFHLCRCRVPTPARPTPPSGTSAVTSPVEAAEKEEEHEEAPESVSNQAVAYRAHEHEPSPFYLLGIVVLAAFAGASLRGRPGRGRRGAQIAPATISTMRTQRRMSRKRGRFL